MLPEQVSRIDSSLIYPALWAKVPILLDACERRGKRYWAISGYRSIPEQQALYAQGRSKPGLIVTKAKGGFSFHNQGIAIDFALDADVQRKGLQPLWDRESYTILAEEASILGLEAGYFWKFQDNPHIQWKLPKGVALTPTAGMRDLLTINPDGTRLREVFRFLDQRVNLPVR